MRRLLIIMCIAVISGLAGALIAGRPSTVPDDLVIASPPSTTTSSTPAFTIPSPTTTTSVATTTAPTTSFAATTAPSTPAPTSAPLTPPLSTPSSTTLVPIEQLRIVVANSTDAPGLAASYSEQLAQMGYVEPAATDTRLPTDATAVYFADGFRFEAIRLAEQIGLPADAVERRPPGPVTIDDAEGDLWLILAADRAP